MDARFTPSQIENAQKNCKTHCETTATQSHFSPGCMKQCWSEFFRRGTPVVVDAAAAAAPPPKKKSPHPSQLEIVKALPPKRRAVKPVAAVPAVPMNRRSIAFHKLLEERRAALEVKSVQHQMSARMCVNTTNTTCSASAVTSSFLVFGALLVAVLMY